MRISDSKFKNYVGVSLAAHVVVFLLMYFSDSFRLGFPQATKITYVRLSYGDGGQNTKASTKKTDTLPAATIRDQKEALKQLAKMKQPPKEKADTPPKLGTKMAEESARPPDRKTVKIGGGTVKTPVPQNASKSDDALSRINDKLRVRQEQFKKIDIGAAQTNGETGQSPWGGAEGNVIDPALIAYYSALKRKVTSQWLLSKDKYSGALVAKIAVLIDATGRVVSLSYEKTSGDGSFDDSAQMAIKRAAPFPAPPESIRDEAVSEGFAFTFNPRAVTGGPR
jgi:colicin import membrane protein